MDEMCACGAVAVGEAANGDWVCEDCAEVSDMDGGVPVELEEDEADYGVEAMDPEEWAALSEEEKDAMRDCDW